MRYLAMGIILVLLALPYVLYIVGYWVVRPADSQRATRSTAEPVSVVLPTYNEAEIVEEKLTELCSLAYPADHLEIIVVDSSDDGTADIVRSFFADRDHPSLTLIEEDERGGVASAVNRAVEAASHEIIFRTDCDSTLAEKSIGYAVGTLQNPSIGAVTGQQTEILGESEVESNYRGLQARNQALESALDSTFIVHGPCFAFRRAFFKPIAADSLADDTEIAVTIRKQGKRVVMNPQLQFAEAGVSDIRARRQRKDRRAMGLLQLLGRHRDALGRYGAYGRIVVPFNWYFLLCSPWLLVGFLLGLFGVLAVDTGLGALAVPTGLGAFVALGHRDRLGPLQPFYAVFDSQLSLLIASLRLLGGGVDGTWEIDSDSRDVFDGESGRDD